MQNEPELLEEFGGNIKLNLSWAKSFLKRIGANKKMARTLPKQLEAERMESGNNQE